MLSFPRHTCGVFPTSVCGSSHICGGAFLTPCVWGIAHICGGLSRIMCGSFPHLRWIFPTSCVALSHIIRVGLSHAIRVWYSPPLLWIFLTSHVWDFPTWRGGCAPHSTRLSPANCKPVNYSIVADSLIVAPNWLIKCHCFSRRLINCANSSINSLDNCEIK